MAFSISVGKWLLDPSSVIRVDWDCIGIGAAIVTPVVVYLSWVIAAGKKKIILYLRRFNRQTANMTLSLAMYGSLRASGRLVVLDDSNFKPISIPVRERLLTVLPAIPVIATLMMLVTLAASVSGPVELESANVKLRQTGCVSVVTGLRATVDRTVYNPDSILASFPENIGLLLIFCLLGLLVLRAFFGGWEARREVTNPSQVRALARRMRALGSWPLAPRLLGTLATVVNVDDALWKTVVSDLAAESKAIILDISHPTEAIQWELQTSVEQYPDKTLLIMDEQDNFTHYPEIEDGCSREDVIHLIEKSRFGGVILYNRKTHAQQKRFGRNLRQFLRSCS